MAEITTLDQIYEYLDENPEIDDYLSIYLTFNQIIKNFEESGNSEELKVAQWESNFFDFRLVDGKLAPCIENVDESGNTVGYPDIKSFNDEIYDYLKARLEASSNPLIKVRYAHILWQSPKKHFKYAEIAIENYLELTSIFQEKDKKNPDKHYGLKVLTFTETAYLISKNTKRYEDVAKSRILDLIKTYPEESTSVFALKARLIKLVISDKKLFKTEDLSGLEDICWKTAQILIKAGKIHFAITFFELGELIDKRLGKEGERWRRKIAESYEHMMNQRLEANEPLVASNFCLDAIDHYKKIKDTQKEEELLKIYSKIKDLGEYSEFSSKIDLTEHIHRCRKIAKEIIQHDPEEIVGFLAANEDLILPDYETVRLRAKELDEKYVMRKLLPIVKFDQHGHPTKKYIEDDEKEYLGVLEQYKLELEMDNSHLIREIFLAAIESGKLGTNDIIQFLRKHSWIGKSFPRSRPNEEPIYYNWLSLIAPSLDEYFLQMKRYLTIPNYQPIFILCIDSLILKLEGLFRDFCRINEVPTSSVKRDGIVQEKLIDELLREEFIIKTFSPDELLFFKFVLIEKVGYNLRNRVAHSLMIFPEYHVDLMHYLIIIMLRIGKYNFVSDTSENTE